MHPPSRRNPLEFLYCVAFAATIYRFSSSLASKARIARNTAQQIGSSASRTSHSHSSSTSGDVVGLQRLWKLPYSIVHGPFYQHQHLSWISSSRQLLASDVSPISSPLIPASTSGSIGTSENKKAVNKPSTVQAVLKGIKMSPKKLNLVAALVRGMRVEDALLQLQVTIKRASKTVYQVIHSARANATHNHGLDADKLLVAEAFVGKGLFKKRVSIHGRGKAGMMVRPECRLTVVVREITADEEAEIARLKVHNFKKMTKRERRLVPHQLIETTPVWDRKGRNNNAMGTA